MAVNIKDTDALDKIAEMEGFAWKQRQENLSPRSFSYFRDKFKDVMELPSHETGVIYGDGGIHRYRVTAQGDIQFIAGLALLQDVQRAEELGFTIS